MQDACHMNFVKDLSHRGVSVAQQLEHLSAESEDLRFDSSWRLRIFSMSHARDKTNKHLSLTNYPVKLFHRRSTAVYLESHPLYLYAKGIVRTYGTYGKQSTLKSFLVTILSTFSRFNLQDNYKCNNYNNNKKRQPLSVKSVLIL